MGSAVAIGAIIIVAGIGWFIRHSKTRKALNVLRGRDALSDDEIYMRFYAASNLSRSDVAELWHEIAVNLRAPASQLRPEDKFGKDVGVHAITSEELDRLSEIARRRAQKIGVPIDFKEIRCVDDYVRRFARLDT